MGLFYAIICTMIELHDEEVVKAMQVVAYLTKKYGHKTWKSVNSYLALTAELEKEAVNKLMEIGLTCHVDCAPILAGKPPVINITGRTTAFDREKKGWEVTQAKKKNEVIHGEGKLPS